MKQNELAAVRNAYERLRDVEIALRDGRLDKLSHNLTTGHTYRRDCKTAADRLVRIVNREDVE